MAPARVLVADDFSPLRHLLTRILTEHFQVLPAVIDGRQLVNSARLFKPDVIVSDVHMPLLTGIEAMRLLKRAGSTAAFVLVSAADAMGPECLEAGADGFVAKDAIAERLVPVVRQVLASRLHARQAEPLPADAERPEVGSGANR